MTQNSNFVALAYVSGLVEASHGIVAEAKRWVLNEKGIVGRAGLDDEAAPFLGATDRNELADAVTVIEDRFVE